MEIIGTFLSLTLIGITYGFNIRHNLYWRKLGYKTWGFNSKVKTYDSIREYSLPTKSWHTKAIYLGNGLEFFWSPGGGFSFLGFFIQSSFNILVLGCLIWLSFHLWILAFILLVVYWMLAVMLS